MLEQTSDFLFACRAKAPTAIKKKWKMCRKFTKRQAIRMQWFKRNLWTGSFATTPFGFQKQKKQLNHFCHFIYKTPIQIRIHQLLLFFFSFFRCTKTVLNNRFNFEANKQTNKQTTATLFFCAFLCNCNNAFDVLHSIQSTTIQHFVRFSVRWVKLFFLS